MNSVVRIPLNPTPEQHGRLVALQHSFAQVCNALSPLVQQTRVWNRVALHHMAYKAMRERFPAMGSQMVCNAIYSVSRAARLVFQSSGSPFHHTRFAGRPLPLLRFADNCPVYFDRHTLSLKGTQASMYTLDGRMRFELALSPQALAAFQGHRLSEIVLLQQDGAFVLTFTFDTPAPAATAASAPAALEKAPLPSVPPYVLVEETA